MRMQSLFPTLYRIVANGRFTSGKRARGHFGMDGRLIYLMGPSGSGKDSLIEAARAPLQSIGCEVVRRVITRSAESVGEDAIGVSREEFARLHIQGSFALCWNANGLDYGIPISIEQTMAGGRDVLVNGSRGHLRQALQRYPTLLPSLLVVDNVVLRERLLRRGRESAEDIEARLRRNSLFGAEDQFDGVPIHRLSNSGELSVTVTRLLQWVKR